MSFYKLWFGFVVTMQVSWRKKMRKQWAMKKQGPSLSSLRIEKLTFGRQNVCLLKWSSGTEKNDLDGYKWKHITLYTDDYAFSIIRILVKLLFYTQATWKFININIYVTQIYTRSTMVIICIHSADKLNLRFHYFIIPCWKCSFCSRKKIPLQTITILEIFN